MCDKTCWQPDASISNLLKRAKLIRAIRAFFAERAVLEVETPAMSRAATTDIHLSSFQTHYIGPGVAAGMSLYLVTSPEFHMKRLLAAGSGPIYQIGRCFRNEEAGRYHNPEFTLLEWYRPRFDMYQLMNEVDDLLQAVLDTEAAEFVSYEQLFIRHLGLNPLDANREELHLQAVKLNLTDKTAKPDDRDTLLQLLFSMVIEPIIGKEKPVFVYHFPASQAALAEISTEDRRVADRFEVYYKGIELANGFRELTNEEEQRQRFELDNKKRIERGLPEQPIDNAFLASLAAGLPECSGVALGVDRLIMIALGENSIDKVLSFTTDKA